MIFSGVFFSFCALRFSGNRAPFWVGPRGLLLLCTGIAHICREEKSEYAVLCCGQSHRIMIFSCVGSSAFDSALLLVGHSHLHVCLCVFNKCCRAVYFDFSWYFNLLKSIWSLGTIFIHLFSAERCANTCADKWTETDRLTNEYQNI